MNASHPRERTPARRAEAGFTLVEIMVVIVILGLLATMVATNVIPQSDQARNKVAQTSVRTIADAVTTYYLQNGRLPESLEALADPEAKGGPLLKQGTKDPWDRAFVLRSDSKKDFEILCLGADGNEGTDDDISSRQSK